MARGPSRRTATRPPDDPPDLAALTARPGTGPHWTTLAVGGREVVTLADLPPLRDRLLFVGLSPAPESVTAGHYHQDRAGQAFWQRLGAARILPPGTLAETADDALVARGHGLTDLVKVPVPADVLTDREITAGVGPLWQKVAVWRPAAVVFIDERAAAAVAGPAGDLRWGRLAGVALAGRPCLLMPARDEPAEIRAAIAFFRDLAGIIEGLLPVVGDGPPTERESPGPS